MKHYLKVQPCEIQLTGLDAKFVGYLKCEVEDDVGQDVEEDEEYEEEEEEEQTMRERLDVEKEIDPFWS